MTIVNLFSTTYLIKVSIYENIISAAQDQAAGEQANNEAAPIATE
jgi:hypothetical protein